MGHYARDLPTFIVRYRITNAARISDWKRSISKMDSGGLRREESKRLYEANDKNKNKNDKEVKKKQKITEK